MLGVESRECSWAEGDRVESEFDNLNVKLLRLVAALEGSTYVKLL
jgi:hypothetical protein